MVQGFEPWLSAPYSTVKLSPRCNVLPKSTCAWLQEFVSLWILFGFGFHKVQFNSWIIACWWLSDYWPIGFPPEPIPSSFPPFFTAGREKKDNLWNSGHARLWLVLLSLGSHRGHCDHSLGKARLTNRRVLTPRLCHRLEEVMDCNTGVTSLRWWPVPHCSQHQVPQLWCKISVAGIIMSVEQLWFFFTWSSILCCWWFYYLVPFPAAAKLLWDLKETAN